VSAEVGEIPAAIAFEVMTEPTPPPPPTD
jgi:hypothetical protein